MPRVCVCGLMLAIGVFALSGGLVGQEAKKDDPPGKVKGTLPKGWTKIGLSEDQIQNVYKINLKYDTEITKLETKIAELKATREKERKALLTAEQKKRLEEVLLGKDK
jgi:hypothetical protein